jgi:hypothetical protein
MVRVFSALFTPVSLLDFPICNNLDFLNLLFRRIFLGDLAESGVIVIELSRSGRSLGFRPNSIDLKATLDELATRA